MRSQRSKKYITGTVIDKSINSRRSISTNRKRKKEKKGKTNQDGRFRGKTREGSVRSLSSPEGRRRAVEREKNKKKL